MHKVDQAMAEQVTITVDQTGNVSVGVEGVAGPHCKKVSEAIEKALGNVTKSERTADYRKAATQAKKA